jgi:hypothetical protein
LQITAYLRNDMRRSATGKAFGMNAHNITTTNNGATMAKRKRAPGGGRKPSGDIYGKRAWFSTRITNETRAAIDREAAASRPRKSVSQIAEALLIEALALRREVSLNDPMQALAYVISQLANVTCHGLDRDWRTDPFMFQALKLAISNFMDGIAPTGEMKSPIEDIPGFSMNRPSIWGPFDTPEARANYVATIVLSNFRTATQRDVHAAAFYMAAVDVTANKMARARAALLRDT